MLGLGSALNLRGDTSRRYLPWIVAFMVFLASLAIAAALVVTSAVNSWGEGLVGTMTVQVPPTGSDQATDGVVADIVEILRGTPGVAEVRALGKAESRALLDPWLGSAEGVDTLPLPRLIDVRLRRNTTVDVDGLRGHIHRLAPGAAVDDHAQWLGELSDLTRAVQIAAGTVVAVIALAAVLTVVYATRSGVAVHHATIEVLHYMGARDKDIARQFEFQAAALGLLGGLIGFALATLVLFAIGHVLPPMEITTLPRLTLDTGDWIALAVVPVAAAAIATVTARLTVLRALDRMV